MPGIGWQYMGSCGYCGTLVGFCHSPGSSGVDALWDGAFGADAPGVDYQGIMVY